MVGRLGIAALSGLLALATPAFSLWPIPSSLSEGTTVIKLSSSFSIQLSGSLTTKNAPSDLKDAVTRTLSQLKNDKMDRLIIGGSASDASSLNKAPTLTSLRVVYSGNTRNLLSIAQNAQLPIGQRYEDYSLSVPAGGVATLTSNSTLGLFRGLTTFTQLWYTYQNTIYAVSAPVTISDKPAYPWRGFMLDTARNYYPVADILRTLDGMSWVKQNVFHWHIVDSQSFPMEVPGFPELSAKGAYSSSQVYTQAQIAEVIAYAGARGIDVMLEIDTPGHTSIIGHSHPDYIACFEAAPWASYANEPPAGQLRLAAPEVLTFTTELFTAVLNKNYAGTLFSTGGDEINANCYNTDNATQAELASKGITFDQALSDFVVNGHAAVRKAGKTPVVWEEMVLSNPVTLGNDTVVLVWISSDDAAAVVQKDFRIVHAPSDYFYLDCGGGGWVGDYVPGNSWCDPFKTWQKAYSFDPLANITADQASLVLGGQHLLWSEQSGPDNLDPIVWPRAAASAEIFWTGATLPDGTAANTKEALPRLHDIRYRMVQRGINAINLQPHWCAVRPDKCDLSA
ncbi:N-acetylhexosaminidase [Clavulina sp. PMI_390]|nr:N-acetylhexosaminidase [Clavulina sp. PMI_390]